MGDASHELPTAMPADAPTTTVTTATTATAAQLWPLLTDPTTPVPFSAELEGARWDDDAGAAPPGLGSRFVGHNRWRDRDWWTTCTVTVCEEPRRFGWTVAALDDPVSDWVFDVRSVANGCRLSFTARMGPSPASGLNRAIAAEPERADALVARRLAGLAASMQRTVDGIAAIAEGRTPVPGE